MDAGAGIGFVQWYLAKQGAQIISIDRSDRTSIPFHLVNQFNVQGYTPSDRPLSLPELINPFNNRAGIFSRVKALVRGVIGKIRYKEGARAEGSVKLFRKDLATLNEIPDGSVDLVVSISALEHNKNIEDVKAIIEELLRILKPGGKMLITLPASDKSDWFHEPAYSWCFTEATLKYIFQLSGNTPSNYDQYESIFVQVKNSNELRNHLSWRYFVSPRSGMPYGKWDPKYLPVGVVKYKA
ncbi:MAG: class I SAM-dependent methyltransferase [Chloroflexi bacterium]|nr:class I SAM-dependent methyltransferase [Chloroflexota bacterium]